MLIHLSLRKNSSIHKHFSRGLLTLAIATLPCISDGKSAAFTSASAGSCDATTGASVSVLGVKTTLSSATLSWTEKRHGDKRYFCYGIGSPATCALVSSRASGAKDQVVTGLVGNTKYAYKFYGVYKNSVKSVVTGTFTTDGSSCGTSVITVVEVDGTALSATGDSLEYVVAKMTRQSDGQLVDLDTTDQSGHFHFEADPGTYFINLVSLPFTPPAPYPVTVVIKKPMTIPDQILKNAFQLSGTVVAAGTGSVLVDATISLLRKSDNSLMGTRTTNTEGHFSFGLVAGDYLINATHKGISLPEPVPVTVTKSITLSNIVLNTGGVNIRVKPFTALGTKQSFKRQSFNIKGIKLRTQKGVSVAKP